MAKGQVQCMLLLVPPLLPTGTVLEEKHTSVLREELLENRFFTKKARSGEASCSHSVCLCFVGCLTEEACFFFLILLEPEFFVTSTSFEPRYIGRHLTKMEDNTLYSNKTL